MPKRPLRQQRRRAIAACTLATLAGLALSGAPLAAEPATGSGGVLVRGARYVMGAKLEIRVWASSRRSGTEALEAAFARVEQLDAVMTTWRPEGRLARLNHALAQPGACAAGIPVSPRLAACLSDALRWSRRTGGLFDPTLGTLIEAWDLRGSGRVPRPRELAAARARSGPEKVRIRGAGTGRPEVLAAAPGLRFDLGGIGKGIALDAAAAALRARGHDAVLLDFAGQVLATGPPPGREGWPVAIAHPSERQRPAVELWLTRGSLATSSNAERARFADGARLGHVIDPRTGRPTGTVSSASVLAGDATAADALASALLVGGFDAAPVIERHADGWLLLEPHATGTGPPRCTVFGSLRNLLRRSGLETAKCSPPEGRASPTARGPGRPRGQE